MYKSVPSNLKKIKLDPDLYKLHKDASATSDFGMDNTPTLLNGGFGLYSTVNLKKNIGPVKTEYFRIALTRRGTASFNIGLQSFRPYRDCMMFGVPGQVFSLHDIDDDFLAYYMLFSEEFASDILFKPHKRLQYPFLTWSGLQCFEMDEQTANEIEGIIFKINEEITQRKAGCSDAIRLFIQLILIHANRAYGSFIHGPKSSSNAFQNLFDSYLKLVSQHFLRLRKVSDYAELLHVSPDHLNRAIKACSEKTAHELIREMILVEAKAYLMHSEMSVSEIAYKLDFADPSHFNRFFRQHCELTPLEFRKQS